MNNLTIPEIFRSKRFWSAIVYLVVMVVRSFNEELGAALDPDQITLIFGILIGGYALQDVALAQSKS